MVELVTINEVNSYVSGLKRTEPDRAGRLFKRRPRHYRSLAQCVSRNFGKGFTLGAGLQTSIALLRFSVDTVRGRARPREWTVYTLTDSGVFFGSLLALFNGGMYATREWVDDILEADARSEADAKTDANVDADANTEAEVEARGSVAAGADLDSTSACVRAEAAPLASSRVLPRRLLRLVRHYRGALAGGLAGLALHVAPGSLRSSIMLFAFVRAVETQCYMLVKRGSLPSVPGGETVLLSVASAQVLWAWIYARASLDKGYGAFLDHQGQHAPVVIRTINALSNAKAVEVAALNATRLAASRTKSAFVQGRGAPLPAAAADGIRYDADLRARGLRPLMCECLHPDKGCAEQGVRYFLEGLRRALPVYVPVYLVPMLLFRRRDLIRQPLQSCARIGLSVARSCTFLSLYCTLAITFVCWGRNLCGFTYERMGKRSSTLALVAGLLAGLANLVEKPARRIELALYVGSHALRSAWMCWAHQKGWSALPPPGRCARWLPSAIAWRHADVLVFSYAFSILGHCFVRHSELLRGSYRSTLSAFLDGERRHRTPAVLSNLGTRLSRTTGLVDEDTMCAEDRERDKKKIDAI